MTRNPVWLIVKREISTRITGKPFIVSLTVLIILILGAGIGYRMLSESDVFDSKTRIALTPATESYRPALAGLSRQPGMIDLEVTKAPSNEAAEMLVREEKADHALVVTDGSVEILSVDAVSPTLEFGLKALAQATTVTDYITELGGQPGELAKRMSASSVSVRMLDESKDGFDIARIVPAVFILFILFMAIVTGSGLIAQGTVEEKSSRIVEILLTTVKPFHLIVGKVLGVGSLILINVCALMITGWGALKIAGLSLPEGISWASLTVWPFLFFLVGFFAYAFIYAGFAALASRSEDVQMAIMPVSVFLVIIFYVLYAAVLVVPQSPLLTVLSYVPLVSCFAAPLALLIGTLTWWQALISFVIHITVTCGLAWGAATLYKRSVLNFGARQSVFKVLRTKQ